MAHATDVVVETESYGVLRSVARMETTAMRTNKIVHVRDVRRCLMDQYVHPMGAPSQLVATP